MTSGYTVQLTGKATAGITQYVRTRPTALSAYTRYIEEAKVWLTRAGAEQWIAERGFPGQVVQVSLRTKRNGRVIPALAA